jgi:hypothetical protein
MRGASVFRKGPFLRRTCNNLGLDMIWMEHMRNLGLVLATAVDDGLIVSSAFSILSFACLCCMLTLGYL